MYLVLVRQGFGTFRSRHGILVGRDGDRRPGLGADARGVRLSGTDAGVGGGGRLGGLTVDASVPHRIWVRESKDLGSH